MKTIKNIITNFVIKLEEAQYSDSNNFYPVLELFRYKTPFDKDGIIKIRFYDDFPTYDGGVDLLIYKDHRTQKVYWKVDKALGYYDYPPINGPFNNFLEAAQNIESYLLIDFDYIKYDNLYEIPLT